MANALMFYSKMFICSAYSYIDQYRHYIYPGHFIHCSNNSNKQFIVQWSMASL